MGILDRSGLMKPLNDSRKQHVQSSQKKNVVFYKVVYITNFKHTSHFPLVSLLLTLRIFLFTKSSLNIRP